MTIKEFAAKNKVRVKLDELQEPYVLAKHGQIYEYCSALNLGESTYGPLFGLMFLTKSSRIWNARREECLAVGMRLIQDGDTEGTFLFNPEFATQAKVAIKTIGARVKRQLSPEARQAATERLARLRSSPPSEAISGVNFESEGQSPNNRMDRLF